ncbi:MAG: hypothetical protein WC043_10890 [Pseudobdellovibrionaceae bacterium]
MADTAGTKALYGALFDYNYRQQYAQSSVPEALKAREIAVTATAGASATADLKAVNDKIPDGSPLDKLITAVGDSPNMGNKDAVLKATATTIVQKWKQDPAILDKLQKDLTADPAAAKRLQDTLVANPQKAAATLQSYNGTNFSQVVASTTTPASKPSIPSAAATAAAVTLPASNQAPVTPTPTRKPEAAPVAAPAGGSQINVPSPPPLDLAALGKEEFLKFADMPDDQIKAKVGPSLTKGLSIGIADYAVEKFGVEKSTADAFKKRIEWDPKLRDSIEKNLKENPDFIRQLAKTMKDEKGLPQEARGAAKSAMTDLMENPEKLAKPDYLSSMTSQMQMAGAATGGFGFLKNMFGMDMNGMMSGIGAWFNKIGAWFNNLMQQFSGGNFLAMRNSGMGLFSAFGAAINQAGVDRDMEALQLPQANYGMVKGKNGEVTHGVAVKDQDGNEVKGPKGELLTKQVPNTVEVTTINGEKHQVIPTAGLTIHRDQQGNFRVPVGTQMEKGQITEMTTLVMNQKEFQEYERKLRDPNGDFAYKGKFDMVYMEPATVTTVDAKSGAVGTPQAQVTPAPQQQPPRVAQATPNPNDPRLEPEKTS